jgi:putative coproporphyrinogen dehydrogenase
MFSLYLHIPFCKRKCPYCDFYSQTNQEDKERYLSAVQKELALYADYFHDEVVSIYFGGGTPSLLNSAEIGALLNCIARIYSVSTDCEITLESNPEQASVAYYRALYNAGINRLSIGVQSLDNRILQFLGRGHNAQEALYALEYAQHAGFRRISADVIYGIPSLSTSTLEATLRTLVGIEHISAYHLTLEEATAFGRMHARGKLKEVDEETSIAHFNLCNELLGRAGYEHYEISSFAQQSGYSRHNMGYWFDRPYLGVGAAAHSYDGRRRWWNHSNIQSYMNTITSGSLFPNQESLNEEERWEEWLLTHLRTQWGLNLAEGEQRFGRKRIETLIIKSRPLLQSQLLQEEAGRLYIPPNHFLVADEVIRELC